MAAGRSGSSIVTDRGFNVLRTLHDDCMQIASRLRQQSSMGNVIVFALLLTAWKAGRAGFSQAVELTAIR